MTIDKLLTDVANHKLTFQLDSGLYRHLRFRQPDTGNLWFDLITWPGSLAINGDMGTWVFARVDDMFTFFRSDPPRINASYWSEKITSESVFGGPHQKFNAETFEAGVRSRLEGYGLSSREKALVLKGLREEVFGVEDESEARRALSAFKRGGFAFSDSWEINGKGYTHHYLWCLCAIVWGIQQYDAARATPGPQAAQGVQK
jgi:hypothetical protein